MAIYRLIRYVRHHHSCLVAPPHSLVTRQCLPCLSVSLRLSVRRRPLTGAGAAVVGDPWPAVALPAASRVCGRVGSVGEAADVLDGVAPLERKAVRVLQVVRAMGRVHEEDAEVLGLHAQLLAPRDLALLHHLRRVNVDEARPRRQQQHPLASEQALALAHESLLQDQLTLQGEGEGE